MVKGKVKVLDMKEVILVFPYPKTRYVSLVSRVRIPILDRVPTNQMHYPGPHLKTLSLRLFTSQVREGKLKPFVFLPPIGENGESIEETLREVKGDFTCILRDVYPLFLRPRLLVKVLVNIKKHVAPDLKMLVPCVPPCFLPLMAYLEVELIDVSYAIVKAEEGVYITFHGEYDVSGLEELPCNCEACKSGNPKESREDLILHNLGVYKVMEKEVNNAVKKGRLRELLEVYASTSINLMAAVRVLDREYWEFLDLLTPVTSKTGPICVSDESFWRPEFVRWYKRLKERYKPPKKQVLFLLPCSAKKPYSKSKTHRTIKRVISNALKKMYLQCIHEVIVTSPLGLVPRELELVYPAAHYDVVVTGHWSHEEVSRAVELLIDVYEKGCYERVIALATERGYEAVYMEFSRKSGVKVEMARSLKELEVLIRSVADEFKPAPEDKTWWIKKVIDFQFGLGVGELLIPSEARVLRGPGNSLRVLSKNGELIGCLLYTSPSPRDS